MNRILIIDDEPSIRFTLGSFLEDAGYEVDTAKDYEEALGKIDASAFDLIFADILLGSNTGMDVLRCVRGRGLDCRVVIITGYPHADTASEAEGLGAFDYIPKPVLKEDILRIAKKALGGE